MYIKDIFKLFIKLFSIYFAFWGIISFIETILNFALNNFISLSTLWYFTSPIAYILLFVLLFFKTDFLISFLNLNKGFIEEKVNLGNLNSREIIKLSILIVGLILFIENIPEFISHCFYSFKYSTESKMYVDNSYNKKEYLRWTITGINILIGYLIIFNHRKISSWIDKKQE